MTNRLPSDIWTDITVVYNDNGEVRCGRVGDEVPLLASIVVTPTWIDKDGAEDLGLERLVHLDSIVDVQVTHISTRVAASAGGNLPHCACGFCGDEECVSIMQRTPWPAGLNDPWGRYVWLQAQHCNEMLCPREYMVMLGETLTSLVFRRSCWVHIQGTS